MNYLIVSDKIEYSKRLWDRFCKVLLERNEIKHRSRFNLTIETKDLEEK